MHCQNSVDQGNVSLGGSVALVGHPNVGKSVLFQLLTGQHVIISNYPGTTIELTRAAAKTLDETIMIDTPGVITFPPLSDDELVTARVLVQEPLKGVLQVGDAKNLRRTLLLTVQLAEMGIPMVLALNMMDEAHNRGVAVDHSLLSEYLHLSVVPTTATQGQGIDDLTSALQLAHAPQFRLNYAPEIENCVAQICSILSQQTLPNISVSLRSLALLWLSGDSISEDWLHSNLDAVIYQQLTELRDRLQISFVDPVSVVIQRTRMEYVDQVVSIGSVTTQGTQGSLSASIGRWTTHPVVGLLILGAVLYGMYWFVGVFGAGTLVDYLESHVFGELINPIVAGWVARFVPITFIADLFVGEYGLWTMGMTYALALIMPIVTTFFIAFGVMEDSGYLPRLAALTNRMFQSIGLNGKAILPMVLGLGCVTMATVTTRVLESKRERFLVTLLLALAVPCSAQLGVVMGMLAGISLTATLIWSGVVFLIFLVVGWLAARLMPGDRSKLMVELPPLRWPMFSNVLMKTLARLEWYLKEVVPLFLLGTLMMFFLDKTGILQIIIRAGEPLVAGWLGLPAEASAAFLMGFLRRDFGATGLFVMQSQGLLTPVQVVVAMVTITLFVPCVASVLMIAKERGWRTAAGMTALIIPLAFFVGGLLDRLILYFGLNL